MLMMINGSPGHNNLRRRRKANVRDILKAVCEIMLVSAARSSLITICILLVILRLVTQTTAADPGPAQSAAGTPPPTKLDEQTEADKYVSEAISSSHLQFCTKTFSSLNGFSHSLRGPLPLVLQKMKLLLQRFTI
jgi:hypothetical protein